MFLKFDFTKSNQDSIYFSMLDVFVLIYAAERAVCEDEEKTMLDIETRRSPYYKNWWQCNLFKLKRIVGVYFFSSFIWIRMTPPPQKKKCPSHKKLRRHSYSNKNEESIITGTYAWLEFRVSGSITMSQLFVLDIYEMNLTSTNMAKPRTTISRDVQTWFSVQLAFAKFLSNIKGNF